MYNWLYPRELHRRVVFSGVSFARGPPRRLPSSSRSTIHDHFFCDLANTRKPPRESYVTDRNTVCLLFVLKCTTRSKWRREWETPLHSTPRLRPFCSPTLGDRITTGQFDPPSFAEPLEVLWLGKRLGSGSSPQRRRRLTIAGSMKFLTKDRFGVRTP